MPAPAWENLDDFLDLDTDGGFAFSAVIQFRDNTSKTVSVIFDDPYFDAQIGEYAADTSSPRITGKESDLGRVRRGDTITIAGETFLATASAEPDGTGTAVVHMTRQDDQL